MLISELVYLHLTLENSRLVNNYLNRVVVIVQHHRLSSTFTHLFKWERIVLKTVSQSCSHRALPLEKFKIVPCVSSSLTYACFTALRNVVSFKWGFGNLKNWWKNFWNNSLCKRKLHRWNFFLRGEAAIRLDNVRLGLLLPWVHPLSSPCRSPPRVLVSEGWCRLWFCGNVIIRCKWEDGTFENCWFTKMNI